MPSIHELVSDRVETTITVKGLKLKVEYAPSAITMRSMAELSSRASAGDMESIAEVVVDVLQSWDLEGPLTSGESGEELVAAGEVIPIELDMLMELPGPFLIELSTVLQDRVTNGPNPTKGSYRSRKR